MKRHKVATILGTSLEAIKMGPVIQLINNHGISVDNTIISTANNGEMLKQALSLFGLKVDIDISLLRNRKNHEGFNSSSLSLLSGLLMENRPEAILINGDTKAVVAAALAAFYQGIQVGHVEAGTRSQDRPNQFPKEISRYFSASFINMHFAPSRSARFNLLREGVAEKNIYLTGNTIIDAIRIIQFDGDFEDEKLKKIDFEKKKLLFVTIQRQDNSKESLLSICKALEELVYNFDDVEVVCPVHFNPNVGSIIREALYNRERIHLINPISYKDMLRLIDRSKLLLTDLEVIQEVSPYFHKPVLVLREFAERPEIIDVGAGKLIGSEKNRIVEEATVLLTDAKEYEMMSKARNPFGDGHASEVIVGILQQHLSEEQSQLLAA